MPPDMVYEPRTTNDKSSLTEAWHPAMLCAIVDELTPASWQMAAQSPRLWRWQFAVFADLATLTTSPPERQSTVSAQKFSPGGQAGGRHISPAKAYTFACKLLGRQIQAGERINLDPLMPLPCEVLISRRDKLGQLIEYANITDVRAWPEGQAYVTDAFKAALAAVMADMTTRTAPTPSPAPVPSAQPVRPPAMASWGQPATAAPTPVPAVAGAPADKQGW